MHWPRTRKWKHTWAYRFWFRIITWKCESWLPSSVPIKALIIKSVFSKLVGNIWRVEAGRGKAQMRKIYYFHLWYWRRASWLATGKCRGCRVHRWEVGILKEKGTLQKSSLPLCLSDESLACVLGEVEYLWKAWERNSPCWDAAWLSLQHLATVFLVNNLTAELLTISSSCVWNNLTSSWHLRKRT